MRGQEVTSPEPERREFDLTAGEWTEVTSPGPERREFDLTVYGEWTEIGETWRGKARAMPGTGEGAGTKAWVTEDGMVDADGPITVDYYEA